MKKMGKIIVIGVCFGLALLLLQISFGIDEAAFIHAYWIAAPAMIISVVFINICYNLFYLNRLKKIAKLLNQGNPQEYIHGIEHLLKTAKGETLRTILKLNLAAGYIETKQFEIAIPMLEKLSDNQWKGSAVHVVHKINLCLSYFETAQYDKAITIYDENQPLLQQHKNHRLYGGNIAMLDIMAAIINEQYDRAEELLDIAKKKYSDSRLQKSFQELFDILNEAKAKQHQPHN